jgi:hypothetical protein
MFGKFKLYILLAALVVVISACAGTPATPQSLDMSLVGKWATADGTGMGIAFGSDGRMLWGTVSAKNVFQYEAANGKGKYWTSTSGKFGAASFEYSVDGDQLSLTIMNNLIYEMKRVQS